MTIEQELISRYFAIIKKGVKNPYYPSKREWQKDVFVKINELKKIRLNG